MNIQEILDSIYIIPVILDYLEKPTEQNREILRKHHIDIEAIHRIKHLLQYHNDIVRNDFKANYDDLREGLKEYFDEVLYQIPQRVEVGFPTNILDYGSGSGQMARGFARRFPNANILTLDKFNQAILKIDFEENPFWHDNYKNSFDIVIMSELLHCKNYIVKQYLIGSALKLLNQKGNLIIVENLDYIMAWRISKIKGSLHTVVTPENIEELVFGKFSLIQKFEIGNHIVYNYEKI